MMELKAMEVIQYFINVVGIAMTVWAIIAGFFVFFTWNMGLWPMLKRFGFARWKRRILIVGDNERASSLKTDLVDSGVFREKNIDIASKGHLAKVKESSLILLDYKSFENNSEIIKEIISYKKYNSGMVVYYPIGPKRIPDDITQEINNCQFTTLCNMRGRLVNDLVVTLWSTSYEKK